MSARPAPEVALWIAGQPEDALFTTTICQAEILAGLAVMPEGRRRVALETAAHAIFTDDFNGRVLRVRRGGRSVLRGHLRRPSKGRPLDRAARSDDRSRRARQRCRRGHTRYRRFRRLRRPTCRSVAGFILKTSTSSILTTAILRWRSPLLNPPPPAGREGWGRGLPVARRQTRRRLRVLRWRYQDRGTAPVLLERRQSVNRALPHRHVHRQHRAAPRHGRRTPGQGAGRDGARGIHHAKQWRLDHVRQTRELTAGDAGDRRLAAITTRSSRSPPSAARSGGRNRSRCSSAGSAARWQAANPAQSREWGETPHGKRSCCET
jgi:hypothetical protein